ncbi:MAG TPA: hypothetical protein VNF68_04360 [Candidatus Baltobacteraceae bacterium]|nr:hypothetical protein [Candidatus Baltobacteraceae bacterium]
MRITRELCDAIERVEVEGLSSCIRNARERFPDVRPDMLAIGGGIAVFAGIDSPLSEGTGIGLWESAGEAEAEALVCFYRDRAAPARVRVSPHADLRFVRGLAARGCVPISYENMMVADLTSLEASRDARVQAMGDELAWSRASASAFADGAPITDADMGVPMMLCTIPDVTALEIRVNSEVVATGCMDVNGEVAGFFAASTLPAYRGKGFQGALIRDRIARGLERGARIGRVTTRPTTASEQNFRRIGFVPLYTSTVWGIP